MHFARPHSDFSDEIALPARRVRRLAGKVPQLLNVMIMPFFPVFID